MRIITFTQKYIVVIKKTNRIIIYLDKVLEFSIRFEYVLVQLNCFIMSTTELSVSSFCPVAHLPFKLRYQDIGYVLYATVILEIWWEQPLKNRPA